MDAKCQLFFTGNLGGWSETYYTSGRPNLEACMIGLEELAEARRLMMSPDVTLYERRASDDNVRNDSLVSFEGSNASKIFETSAGSSTAVLIRIEGGVRYRRSLYSRGGPYTLTIPLDNTDDASSKWYSGYLVWKEVLLNGAIPWFVKVRSKEPDAVYKDIVGVVNHATLPGYMTVNALAHGLTAGSQVELRFSKTLSPLWAKPFNATYQVFFPTENTFTVVGTVPVGVPLLGINRYRPIKPFFARMTGVQIMRMTRRKGGQEIAKAVGAKKKSR